MSLNVILGTFLFLEGLGLIAALIVLIRANKCLCLAYDIIDSVMNLIDYENNKRRESECTCYHSESDCGKRKGE